MRDPSPELDAFGRTLRNERRHRDLSQDALAHFCGVSAKHIGEIERANADPRLSTVLRLSDGLRLSVSELFAPYEERLTGG